MELEQFIQETSASLEDFTTEVETPSPVNSVSASNIAAQSAVMDGTETMLDTYRQTKQDLLSPVSSQMFILDQQVQRDKIMADLNQELSSILGNPEASFEEKSEAYTMFEKIEETALPDLRNEVAYKSLSEESEPTDTDSMDMSRNLMVDSILEVQDQKRNLQNMINSMAVSENPTMTKTIGDIAEIMVPFVEWEAINKIWREVEDKGQLNTRLLGDLKVALFSNIKNIPMDQREAWAKSIIDLVNENESILFSGSNDVVKLDTLNRMIVDNDYSDLEKWFDSTTSVLDVVGIGALARAVIKGGRGTAAVVESSEALRTATRTDVNPASVGETVAQTNPRQARAMDDMNTADETGNAAEATYGTTREEVVANNHLPEAEIVVGEVRAKPSFAPSERVRGVIDSGGQTAFTAAEKAAQEAAIVGRLEDIEGAKMRGNSLTVRESFDGGMTIRGLFSLTDTGYKTAEEALGAAGWAFRHQGMKESDFTLMVRTGDTYEVADAATLTARAELRAEFVRRKVKIPEEIKPAIDYAVAIDFTRPYDPNLVGVFDFLDTKRNVFDRWGVASGKGSAGSLTQTLLPADTVLHQQITKPASVAVNRSVALRKSLVEMFGPFVDQYSSLKKGPRKAVSDYLHKANYDGIKYDVADLINRGFTVAEREVIKSWRKANDGMYHVVNSDLVNSLRNRGFQVFFDKGSNTQLFVKPVGRAAIGPQKDLLDTATGQLIRLNKGDLDDLYAKGGGVVRTEEPFRVGEEWVEYVINRNTPTSGYTRALRADDTVLAYRDGYYPVVYDAEYFITKTFRVGNDETITKAVATARTSEEARNIEKALKSAETDPTVVYANRRDRKAEPLDRAEGGAWNNLVNSGLSSQRYRGERLADGSTDLHKMGMANLSDPLEAIASQIRSVSERTSMRSYLDTVKARWVSNFSKHLDEDVLRDRFGQVNYPQSWDNIKTTDGRRTKQLADARTLFNYIRSLEDGYVNTLDDSVKGLMHMFADIADIYGVPKAEATFNAVSKFRPTVAIKSATFKLFLAAHPMRQALIQAHQTIQLFAIEPKYMLGGGFSSDVASLLRGRLGTGSVEDAALYNDFVKSGLADAVDANNLVRDDTLHLADLTWQQKARSVVGAPLKFSQRLGFDVGEETVLATAWLTYRNKALTAGKPLSASVMDEVVGNARNFTYNMDKAGDMPYNQNSLNVIMQFMQVPHKAVLQPLINRGLSGKDKAQLVAFNTAMYGIPTATLAPILYPLVAEGPARDALEFGLEDVILNATLSAASGTDTNIDFGDLSPIDSYGLADTLVGMVTTDLGTIVSNAPAATIMFGGNSRIGQLMKTSARYFNIIDDYEEPGNGTRYTDVALAAGNLFSGFSSMFKGLYALETRQKISALGVITDEDVTKPEAILQALFGLKTKDESSNWEINRILYQGRDAPPDPNDVKLWYNELKRHFARRGMSTMEAEFQQRVLAEAWRVFDGSDIKARESILSYIQADVKSGDDALIRGIMSAMGSESKGFHSNRDVSAMIEKLPDSAQKEQLRIMFNNFLDATGG
ncbi:MAG: hypothetical protein GQ574_14650 [Crocinitomix sp.]|nr:hypothetical protein [Crocinitomix sp.]